MSGRVVLVVGLREPPRVVVAEERARPVAGADADLDVEGPAPGVPHLLQPLQAVPGLGEEGARCAPAQEPGAGEQQDVVVRRGVGELEVVAGVVPAALDVDRAADRAQPPVQDQVRTAGHPGPRVDRGVGVEQVRGPAVQRAGDDVAAVALVPVERDAHREQGAEEPPRAGHLEHTATGRAPRPGPRPGSGRGSAARRGPAGRRPGTACSTIRPSEPGTRPRSTTRPESSLTTYRAPLTGLATISLACLGSPAR